jgi:hypothetical protein
MPESQGVAPPFTAPPAAFVLLVIQRHSMPRGCAALK